MWTRLALVVVNIWLSYPYFYVVTSGALRAIPDESYDAAEVDGASAWQRFRFITFPQLIAIVMPLLIASFAFNFNVFNLIYIFNEGNPPMAGTSIPIGHTDILISFIYKLAFSHGACSRLRPRRGDLGRPVRRSSARSRGSSSAPRRALEEA